MPDPAFFYTVNKNAREVFVSSGRPRKSPSGWKAGDDVDGGFIGAVPRRDAAAFVSAFLKIYRRWGYRVRLTPAARAILDGR